MAKRENIHNILKNIRKRIKKYDGPLKSVDPKKQQKALEDIEIAKEVKKIDGTLTEKGDDTPIKE